ncbi:MAG: energy transducer TonB [Flavicella sp.]
MKYLSTGHQRKSALLTSILMSLLLLGVYFFGMTYMDPPEEYGVAINFGTSDMGSGPEKIQETIKSAPEQEETAEEQTESEPEFVEEVVEEVLTQETKEAPVITKQKPKKEPVKETPKELKEKPKPVQKPKPKPKPKPSKATQDALSNLLNGKPSEGENASGEGDDVQSGLKGKEKGDPSSSKYYGNTGSGGNGNYNLSGRNPLSRPVVNPTCNEEGIVAVSIQVDNSGHVIKATPGVKGTTNTAPCLLAPAKAAALQTRWNADKNAPPQQTGVIIYHFTLSE